MLWFWLNVVLIKGDKQVNIYWVYHELYEGIWVINRWLIILCELGKVFHCYRINIDCEILAQGELKFKKSFKSY